MRLPDSFAASRVLVIRPRGLGDVVLSTVVLEALARAWPGVAIDYLTERASGDLLRADPRLDGLFLLGPRQADDRVEGGDVRAAIGWMRRRRPTLVLDLFSNPRTAFLTAMSRARFRVGLDKRIRRFAYNVRVPRFRGRPEDDHRYAQTVQCDFLRAAGVRWEGDVRAGLRLARADEEFAAAALGSLGYPESARFGAVLPGGSWESKRWSVEGFVQAGRQLHEELGVPTLVSWGPPERADAEAIAAALGPAGRLAPPTTLRQMAALLGRPAVLVSSDCLGRHVAIVAGVPTVGVFGTTDPRDWTPPDGHHRTVRGGPEQGLESLRELPGAAVVAEIRDLLAEVDSTEPPA